MLRRLAIVTVAVTATAVPCIAQYKDMLGNRPTGNSAYSIPRITIKGYLVDKACAYRAANMDAIGPTHTSACALAGSSLGVIQHGVFYPFDEKGTKKALELLKKSKLTRGVMVQASGNMEDSGFAVSSLKELKPD